MLCASEALKRLQEGNTRFVRHVQNKHAPLEHHHELPARQKPFAIILGCADSRVPPEIIFDQGIGALFVIRVAGNVVTPALLGSIEFAAEQFASRLIVVLGHTLCGAVQATLDILEQPLENISPNLQCIVDCIRPAVKPLIDKPGQARDTLMHEAVRMNIRTSVEQLQHRSPILDGRIKRDELLIIGAEYALQSGEVHFLKRNTGS